MATRRAIQVSRTVQGATSWHPLPEGREDGPYAGLPIQHDGSPEAILTRQEIQLFKAVIAAKEAYIEVCEVQAAAAKVEQGEAKSRLSGRPMVPRERKAVADVLAKQESLEKRATKQLQLYELARRQNLGARPYLSCKDWSKHMVQQGVGTSLNAVRREWDANVPAIRSPAPRKAATHKEPLPPLDPFLMRGLDANSALAKCFRSPSSSPPPAHNEVKAASEASDSPPSSPTPLGSQRDQQILRTSRHAETSREQSFNEKNALPPVLQQAIRDGEGIWVEGKAQVQLVKANPSATEEVPEDRKGKKRATVNADVEAFARSSKKRKIDQVQTPKTLTFETRTEKEEGRSAGEEEPDNAPFTMYEDDSTIPMCQIPKSIKSVRDWKDALEGKVVGWKKGDWKRFLNTSREALRLHVLPERVPYGKASKEAKEAYLSVIAKLAQFDRSKIRYVRLNRKGRGYEWKDKQFAIPEHHASIQMKHLLGKAGLEDDDDDEDQTGSTANSEAPHKRRRKQKGRARKSSSIDRSESPASSQLEGSDTGEGEDGELFEVDMWAKVDPALLKDGGSLQIVGSVRIVQRS